MFFHTFPAGENIPQSVFFPKQMHSTRIQKVETGKEDFAHCDGLWSENPNFLLGIQTADCAPVAFLGREKIGIVHAGWRGLVSGILEEMQQVFSGESHSVRIGPLLPEFEIQKDFCFEAIFSRFGAHFFFEQNGRITFRFLEALTSLLPEAEFCGISTFQNPNYASWRRDQSFPKGKNVSIVSFRKVFLSEK